MADVIIGIDQSYKNTGISIIYKDNIKNVSSVKLGSLDNNSERRLALSRRLERIIENVSKKSNDIVIIIERIRLSSQGFINIDYIKSIGALNACIVDVANRYGIKVYSVDTRCWKAQVVGTSKPQSNKLGIAPEKWPTIQFVISKGFEDKILLEVSKRKKKGVFQRGDKLYTYNDDAADSMCIALFGLTGDKNKLKEEH